MACESAATCARFSASITRNFFSIGASSSQYLRGRACVRVRAAWKGRGCEGRGEEPVRRPAEAVRCVHGRTAGVCSTSAVLSEATSPPCARRPGNTSTAATAPLLHIASTGGESHYIAARHDGNVEGVVRHRVARPSLSYTRGQRRMAAAAAAAVAAATTAAAAPAAPANAFGVVGRQCGGGRVQIPLRGRTFCGVTRFSTCTGAQNSRRCVRPLGGGAAGSTETRTDSGPERAV